MSPARHTVGMIGSRHRALAVVTALACLAPAASAVAQDDGVFIDPESPTAKEYALPIESARRQADPAGSQAKRIEQGAAAAPLFGEGIVTAGGTQRSGESASASSGGGGAGGGSGSSGSAGAGSSGSAGGRPSGSAGAGSGSSGGSAAAAAIPPSRPGTPEGGLSFLYVGAAVLVLIVGALAGLLLRRRHES